MAEFLHKLLAEQLNCYRMQRHDFMNDWQVVMGYLQLNKTEAALNYLKEKVRDLQSEQAVAQIPEPLIHSILLRLILQLKKQEIKVAVAVAQPLTQADFWKNHAFEEYAELFYGYTKECIEEGERFSLKKKDLKGEIILTPVENFDVLCLFKIIETREQEEIILCQKEFRLRSKTHVL